MKLRIACHCGANLSVDSSHAGRQVRCPRCENPILVPTSVQVAPVNPPSANPPAPSPSANQPRPAVSSQPPQHAATPPVAASGPTPNINSAPFQQHPVQMKPSGFLQMVGVFMMVYGALNALVSFYVALQVSNSTEMMSELTRWSEMPGGSFLGGMMRSGEQFNTLPQ